MFRRSIDLIIIASVTISINALAVWGAYTAANAILGFLFVLVIPGYALTAALFPNRTLRASEWFALCLSLSLALAVVSGLALNWTPWGMTARSWAVLLGGITLLATVVALFRRHVQIPANNGVLFAGFSFGQVLMIGGSVAIVLGALAIARWGAVRQEVASFTQFWILPVEPDNQDIVRIGVINNETQAVDYSVSLVVNGQLLSKWDSFQLKPGEKWEKNYELSAPVPEGSIIEAFLYRQDNPNVAYRHVFLRR